VFKERISHFRISLDEFSITDQLIKHLNKGLAGQSNDRSPQQLILNLRLTELTLFRKWDLPGISDAIHRCYYGI
jgi:hypothetical protein